MQIFHVLTAIIERLGVEVQPFTGGFLQLLPLVWQQAEDQPLVRMQAGPTLGSVSDWSHWVCCVGMTAATSGPHKQRRPGIFT